MIAAEIRIKRLAICAWCLLLFAQAAVAQSTDQNFPTPVTTNELNGIIKARDMGDSRQTSYFYAFDGGQGDIFINVVTKNFSGDIDVFSAETLTPLTKMVIYADGDSSETGRLIYLRKPDRLILRVEGRTPNDDPATFRIKFAGSFIASAPQKADQAPTVAKGGGDEPGVKVNSVGTIVAVIPKPRPTPKVEEPAPVKEKAVVTKEKPKTGAARTAAKGEPASTKPSVDKDKNETVYENKSAKVIVEPAPKSEPPASVGGTPAKPKTTTPSAKKPKPAPKKPAPEATTGENATPETSKLPEKAADALASIRLVIQMKDGTVFWLPMDKVLKFTVDKGVMTVISKDGSITRYSLLDVEKTTIQ